MDVCVSMITSEGMRERECVCVFCLDVCETGVIELRGFSVFGGRGEIGIFRFH